MERRAILVQMHQVKICRKNSGCAYITFVLCFLPQARMALEKGAQAVIFDVSDDVNAAVEVSAKALGPALNVKTKMIPSLVVFLHLACLHNCHSAERNRLPSPPGRACGC